MNYEKHEFNIFPEIKKKSSAYQQLSESLANGYRKEEPIILYEDKIIDGWNRYLICKELDITPTFKTLNISNRVEAITYIKGSNARRDLLDDDHRVAIYIELHDFELKEVSELERRRKISESMQRNQNKKREKSDSGHGAHHLIQEKPKEQSSKTRETISQETGVGEKKVQKLITLKKTDPENFNKILNNQAKLKDIEKEKEKQKRIEREVTQFNDTVVNDEFISIHNVDFREYAKNIPDGSIDLILTDPPYPQEFLPLWGDLSVIAKRILKPNGFLIAYSGQLHLNKVFNYLDANLNYYWTFALRHTGGNQLIHPRNIFCGWKPLLVFQNGLKKIDFQIEDFITGTGREKEFHDWQQSELEIYDIIQRFTKAGDTVFEPFLGGGTTATACMKLKRKIIGCEIVKESFISAKGRIYNEQSK